MVLCDIGNTTFAFLINKKKLKVSIDTKLKNLPTISENIYFTSVNNKITKRFLKRYPTAINIKKYLKFDTQYIGMGTDRQLVCQSIKDGIIVDCGSAITIDIMKDGKHKGGFILAGLKNIISFYPKISKQLKFNFVKNINLDKMPLTTKDAISYAVLKSIILPIKECEIKYNLKVYFTGEDSKYIVKHFKNAKYEENLIFNEMKKIIRNGRKQC